MGEVCTAAAVQHPPNKRTVLNQPRLQSNKLSNQPNVTTIGNRGRFVFLNHFLKENTAGKHRVEIFGIGEDLSTAFHNLRS